MKPQKLMDLRRRLSCFLQDLLEPMGRKERRHWARVYLEGLLLDGERKSIEPLAARLAGADVQALRQFVGQSPWAVEEVGRRLALKMVDLLAEAEVWMVDDTSFPKAGKHSVGVARQYCGALGKIANCQVAVTLHWSGAAASCPLGWRLYLPQEWCADPERLAKVKAPADVSYRTKSALALELVDQMLAWGVPPRPLVADSFYGNEFDFRKELRQRKLPYVVQVEPSTVAWDTAPDIPPPAPNRRGRPRRHPPWEELPRPRSLSNLAQTMPVEAWQGVEWREGSRGPQRSRFAVLQVWAAHAWRNRRQLERPSEWLLMEWPENAAAPSKYWLCWFDGPPPGLRHLVRLARSRWRIELDYRELKDELGLDHYEGRHWLGWHHHVWLVTIAYAFLRSEQVRLKKNFWCDLAPDA
ncbi:MAG: IS701 family transposase [Deltaproteobacteria bacterium]|nr:IS701 family transposase [Deltaproteobacteria bacterium]